MSPEVAIAGRPIGPAHAPYVICELSGNHNGSLERALLMLDGGAFTTDVTLELSPGDLDVLAGMAADAEPASDEVDLVSTDTSHFVASDGGHYMVTTSVVRLHNWRVPDVNAI